MPTSDTSAIVDRWIESVAGVQGGLPVIRGTRISVRSVAVRLEAGDTLEEIAAENPDLPFEAFQATALFADKASPR